MTRIELTPAEVHDLATAETAVKLLEADLIVAKHRAQMAMEIVVARAPKKPKGPVSAALSRDGDKIYLQLTKAAAPQ